MRAFLEELRRRGVAKAAAVYAVAAAAVMETSSVVFPALYLPEWTVTFVVLLALLGFPIALALAWTFDWTRQGIVRTPARADEPPAQSASPHRGRALDFAIIAVLVVVVGWLGWGRIFDTRTATGVLDSIAVLPFVNLSGDPANEYFGDGLAEELLNSLVRIDGLRVAARTSSFEYKGRNMDVRRIGEALNVATVLEGSVRKAGERIRVTAQLVRSDDGFHLWSETFDRSLEDIFAVQDEIAFAIADSLRMQLGARERAAVAARSTTDVAAFEAYLRGRFEMHRRTQASLDRAVEEFRAAIAADPGYAPAYSGLADTWILRNSYGGVSLTETMANAEPMARRALELDPTLAEAHASWGFLSSQKGDYVASVDSFLRAIELNPSYSPAYHWLGLSYESLGRFDDAIDVLRKAVEMDPQYITGKRALLNALRRIGLHSEADVLAERLMLEHPGDPMLFYGLGTDAQILGRPVDALRYYARGLAVERQNMTLRIAAAAALAGLGDLERADEQMEIVHRLQPTHPLLAVWPVQRAAAVGDVERIRLEADRLFASMPPGFERDQLACQRLLVADLAANAAAGCRSLLARAGWQPGERIPAGWVDAAAMLYLAAKELGDTALEETLVGALQEEYDRLAESGLGASEVRWVRALFAAHASGDNDELLAVLPDQLGRGFLLIEELPINPLFAPLRGDPRFAELLAQLRARQARERALAQHIEIPAL